jgi:hypothetical protein
MRRTTGALVASALTVAGAAYGPATPATAGGGTYSVTSTANSGPGSYRQALADASAFAGPGDATVTVAAGLTVHVTGGDVPYTGSQFLVLDGQGATIDGTDSQHLLVSTATPVSISDVHFTDGAGAVKVAAGTITDSTFSSGAATGGGAIQVTGIGLNVSGSTFTGNEVTDDGGAILGAGGIVTITSSTFTGNIAHGDGGAVATGSGNLTVDASTMVGNQAGGNGGAVAAGGPAYLVNSTFRGNAADVAGGMFHSPALVGIRHVTATRNSAPAGAHVASQGPLTTGRTVYAEPQGGGSACELINATASEGYNRASDGSCQLTAGTDQVSATLVLGPLADNGGPTPTLLPGAGLADVIPEVDCDPLVLTDQRGLARPQGDGCDIGAVDIEPSYRPDAHLRSANRATFVGNGVHNLSGAHQTVSQAKARGTKATFVVRLQNDGTAADPVRLRGPGTSNRFTVRYRVGATNITGAVVAGTYETAALNAGGTALVTVEITVRTAARRGSTTNFALVSRSDTMPGRIDTVRAAVRVT